MITRNRKIGVAVAGGALLAGVFAASAASLGSLTVESLGTTANVVAACQSSGLTAGSWNTGGLAYNGAGTATDTSGSTYDSTGFVLGGIAGCASKPYKVTVADAAGASLQEVTGTLGAGPTQTITYPATDSKKISQVTITIYG